MAQEPRKATDVLLDLESKIDILLGIIKSQDLNIKVLSNKLGEVMSKLDKQATLGKITVEAAQGVPNQAAAIFNQTQIVDPERAVVITAESKLPMDNAPQGFRRVSRPESYAGDDAYLAKDGVPPPRQMPSPKPPPGRSANDTPVIVQQSPQKKTASKDAASQPTKAIMTDAQSIIPVEQRVVDRNGKSVFLADVEVIDLSSGEQVSKSRSNGAGKWMAALPVGEYKVIIRKLESLTRTKIESIQTITVDGTQSPLKLSMVIIK